MDTITSWRALGGHCYLLEGCGWIMLSIYLPPNSRASKKKLVDHHRHPPILSSTFF